MVQGDGLQLDTGIRSGGVCRKVFLKQVSIYICTYDLAVLHIINIHVARCCYIAKYTKANV